MSSDSNWQNLHNLLKILLFIDTFLCSPKEKYPKETAPCAPLLPACPERSRGARLKTGGALSNSAFSLLAQRK
jgi:hypothetical protein